MNELDAARQTMQALLAELPSEFSSPPGSRSSMRTQFSVVTRSNVKAVHEALWELQVYLGMQNE